MNTEFWDTQEEKTMSKRRPERAMVEEAYMENSKRKAHEIAEVIGLIETMGYDRAINYVKAVKKSMRNKGQITGSAFASDSDRLTDINTLFALRHGKMSKGAAYFILLMNCYLRLRSEDDDVHMMAIDSTYEMNKNLEEPFLLKDAIHICDIAVAQYMNSIDEHKNVLAKKKGYPGAGLNYTDERFIEKLGITEEELQHMISIRKEEDHGGES